MIDRNPLPDLNETPEDVATLYSWANLHGAKYRDFSASRAQTREKARQRVQDVIESEQRRATEEAEAQKAVEVLRAVEEVRQAQTSKDNAARAEQQAAARPVVSQSPRAVAAPENPVWHSSAPQYSQPAAAPRPAQPAAPANVQQSQAPMASQSQTFPQPLYRQPEQFSQSAANHSQASQNPAPQKPQQTVTAQYSYAYQPQASAPVVPTYAQQREDHYLSSRANWAAEAPGRPAWLGVERSEASAPVLQQEDTLQGSRDRLTSRWFALKGVFNTPALVAENPAPATSPARAPVLAVFSLAGGVGKTSVVASLGRTLASRGERVLLVDTTPFGLLPFYFGARDQRPGVLRTFTAPGASGDASVQMLALDPESMGQENAAQEMLSYEISRNSQGIGRVIVDLATASGATTRRILRMSPTVLVPMIPDMSSVVSVNAIDSFFRNNSGATGQPVMPVYVLNQFDASVPLHLDVREVLREQLGDRLLPFALRRTPAISEALAEGMTVVDYAPNSTAAEDFGALAGWVKSLAAPASAGFRGVRWSER